MIGYNALEIGARSDGVNDFVLGMGQSSESNDGGFSPESLGVNVIAIPGILNAPGAVTDKSTNLTDEIIASCEDPTYLGNDRYFLDDTGAFYTWNGTTLTKKVTASSDLFTQGTTDFIPWNTTADGLMFYATTKAGSGGDIVRYNGNATLVENWWTNAAHLNQSALSSTTPWRPLLVFETYLYIGDANKLHRVDIAKTVSNGILTLGANEIISALGIDNASGKMLIAVTTASDYSASRNGRSKIYYYDGYSNKAIKACEVNGLITSFVSVGNDTYVFYGNKFGQFIGSGIQHLRTLDFAIGTATLLIYPHRRTVIDNTIYIAENDSVLAYGEIVPGRKVFYYAVSPDTSSQNFTCLTAIGGNQLGFSYATNTFKIHNVTSIAAVDSGFSGFFSRKYKFSRPIHIHSVHIELYSAALTGTATIGSLRIVDEQGTTTLINTFARETGVTKQFLLSDDLGIKTRLVQLRWNWGTSQVTGVRRFIIYYDYAE